MGSFQSFVQTPGQCRKLSHDRFLLHSVQCQLIIPPFDANALSHQQRREKTGNYLHGTGYLLRSPLATNSRHFVEPERHLTCLRQPATCPYPVPDESNPIPSHQVSFKSILILSHGKFSFLQVFQPKSGMHLPPMLVTCSAHLNFLDVITTTIFGEKY